MSETERALSKAVVTLDSSRRVGWAKAFATAEKLEEASRDINVLTGDRNAFRKGLSYLYGFYTGWTQGAADGAIAQALQDVTDGYDLVLDSNIVAAGLRRGEQLRDVDEFVSGEADRQAEQKLARRQSQDALDKAFRAGQDHERRRLAKRYGLGSVDQLHAVLGAWQKLKAKAPPDAR